MISISSLSSFYKNNLRTRAITTYSPLKNWIIAQNPLLSSELSSDHLSSRPLKILKKKKMTENEDTK
jgi:hypothetical protein